MAHSFVEVDEGTSKKLGHFKRTIGVDDIEVQKMVLDEPIHMTYSVSAVTPIGFTSGNHLLQIMGGTNLHLHLVFLEITQAVAAGANTALGFQLLRLTTAGTGGTALTPRAFDPADPAAEATIQADVPSASKGTESFVLRVGTGVIWAAVPATNDTVVLSWDWRGSRTKAPRVAGGGSTGLALKHTAALATATVHVYAEFIELNYI